MGQLKVEVVETVEQSNFIKAYNTYKEREREDSKIPSEIKALIDKAISEKRAFETRHMCELEER